MTEFSNGNSSTSGGDPQARRVLCVSEKTLFRLNDWKGVGRRPIETTA